MDKNLNELLKWSIEHSAPSTEPKGVVAPDGDARALPAPSETTGAGDPSAPSGGGSAPSGQPRQIDPEILNALFGGPSEAELMKAAIEVITSPPEENVSLEQKLTAFDNLEQLVESLDNANNLEPLSLWSPLLSMLEHEEAELRKMAAWCVGTAVQNNAKTQERLLAMGSAGVPALVKIAVNKEEEDAVRRKAVYAISSAVRNYQPALDLLLEELVRHGHHDEETKKRGIEATDMDAVDEIVNGLRGLHAK